MICNKKKNPPTLVFCTKKVFVANLPRTGSTRDVGHRKLFSWDQEDIAHCGWIGEQDTKMTAKCELIKIVLDLGILT